jgi:lysozyme family protein
MANFEEALKITLSDSNEGGYVNSPTDRGGETYRGISRYYHPDWDGWKVIDSKKNDLKFPKCLDKIAELQEMIRNFYHKYFWEAIKGDAINSQALAGKFFDVSVNISCYRAIRRIQTALNSLGAGLVVDGVMGDITLSKINDSDCEVLLHEFRNEVAEYYAKLNDQVHIKGWLRRLYS